MREKTFKRITKAIDSVFYYLDFLWVFAFIFAMFFCFAAFAQGDEPIGSNAELALTIWHIVGSAVATGLLWLVKKLSDLINAKIKNQLVAGILSRLTISIGDAVAMVNQTLKDEITEAKKSSSHGGEKITKDEADKMKQAVWDAIKAEYGGIDGLTKAMSVLGIKTASAAVHKVDTMIEAAVGAKKGASGN